MLFREQSKKYSKPSNCFHKLLYYLPVLPALSTINFKIDYLHKDRV